MTRRKINLSKAVQRKLDRLDGPRAIVAAVRTVTKDTAVQFEQAGLLELDGSFSVAEPAPPPRLCGPWALRNLDGWEEKRKDLPKELREISSWAPNWNGSGHHLVSRSIEAWPVHNHPARMLTLSAKILELLKDSAIVCFRIDQPLSRADPDLAEKLQFNIRLLHEAVGCADLKASPLTQ